MPATTPEQKILTEIVGMANIIAKVFMMGHECDRFVSTIDNKYLKLIKAPMGITPAFLQSIYSQLNIYNKFLKLDASVNFPIKDTEIVGAENVKILYVNRAGNIFSNGEGYLETQAYNVTKYKGTEIPEKSFKTPHVAVIEVKKEDTLEELTPFIDFLNDNPEKLTVPIVLVHNPESELKDLDVLEGRELVSSSLDLRALDEALAKARGVDLKLKGEENKEAETNGKPDEAKKDDSDPVDDLGEIESEDVTEDVDKLTQDPTKTEK